MNAVPSQDHPSANNELLRLGSGHLTMVVLCVAGMLVIVAAPATSFEPAMRSAVLVPSMWLHGAAILYMLSTATRSTDLGLALRRGECAQGGVSVLAAGHALVAAAMLFALLRGADSRTNQSQCEELLAVVLTVAGLSLALAIWLRLAIRRRQQVQQAADKRERAPLQSVIWGHFATCLLVVAMVIYLETRTLPT